MERMGWRPFPSHSALLRIPPQGSTPDRGASIDDQIDSLTTMLADLESAAPSRWGGARQVQTLLDGGGVGQRKRLLDFGGGGKGRS